MSWAKGRRRTVCKRVAFTPEEWERAKELWDACRAGQGHRTFSGHARELLMWGSVRQVVAGGVDSDALAHEVAKIGVNVNQVAHRVNTQGAAGQRDVAELERLLAECRDTLGDIARTVNDAKDRSGWQS